MRSYLRGDDLVGSDETRALPRAENQYPEPEALILVAREAGKTTLTGLVVVDHLLTAEDAKAYVAATVFPVTPGVAVRARVRARRPGTASP